MSIDSAAPAVTEADVREVAARSRVAAVELAPVTRAAKDAALMTMADALDAATTDVLTA
ncbi:MAG: hypothetical protein QOE89_3575, partial [Pseudonocardiales bacterium]|nr:hypothetical protein [Pseudonocardiales bacterium]